MATAIRLSRGGSKKRPYYKIVVTDSRSPRDGRFIERIGSYNPLLAKGDEKRVVLDTERAKHWISVGAQPTDRVARFLDAADLGYTGADLQGAINGDTQALAKFEAIRAHGAVRMGLIDRIEQAATRQHTPKVAFVAPARDHVSSSGKAIAAGDVDLLVRALSMGKLHHAMRGTAAVAIATAAAVPGTLVNAAAGGGTRDAVRFGHPSGTLRVGAQARQADGAWTVTKAVMSRSARVLMEGRVRVPADTA